MTDTVIKIENLSKEYRLGVISHETLYREVQSWWSKLMKKEDPNAIILPANHRKNLNGEFLALDNISLEIKKGEVLGIVGKNGAGKSTLLKVLSRVTSPSSGNVKIKGRIASLLEVGTGFHPELTGRENVFLNGAILGMTKKEILSKFDEIVEFSGIGEFIDTPVKRYSSGMYVRLAFAVAAHLEPEILIVDEVLAVGDAEFQKKCLGKMKDVAGHGRTVLFVSHNMNAIASLCDKGLYLKDGKVEGLGQVSTIVNSYMTDGHSASSNRKWIETEAPGDSSAKLLEVRLVNEFEKTISYIVLENKKFGIEFTYKIILPVSKPIPQIHLFTNKQDNVFISYGYYDYSEFYNTNEMLNPGIYKSIIWFDTPILNTHLYQVGIGLYNMEEKKLHFWEQEAITFEVLEDANIRKILYKGPIGGIIRPELRWENYKLN